MKYSFMVHSTHTGPVLGPLSMLSIEVHSDGVLLKQMGDTITLDKKQIKELLTELSKEFK